MFRTHTAKKLIISVLAFAVAMTLAACGGGSSDNDDTDNTSSGDWQDNADRTAILRMPTSLQPPVGGTWDPLLYLAGGDIFLARLVYGTLIRQGPDGPEPWLVESWETPEDNIIDLHIREGVTFHDGTAFDSAAVKAGLDRNRGENSPYAQSLSAIDSIDTPDDLTVRLNLNRPALQGLLRTLSGREGVIPSPANLANPETMADSAIGAGPFELIDYKQGASATLRAYEDYYDPDQFPYAGIDFTQNTDPVGARNGLLAGDYDLAAIDWEGVEAVDANPDFGTQVNRSDSAYYINLNTSLSDPPLDDLKVRQALNYGFNRVAIGQALFGEDAEPKWQIFPEGFPGHNPDLDESYPYDPEKAKELLAEAGYPDGFDMSVMVLGPLSGSVRSGEAFASDMAKIGVNVEVVPGTNMTQDYHIDKKYDAGLNWWIPRTDGAATFTNLYGQVGILNASGYVNEELNEIIYAAQGATTPEEYDQKLQEASAIIVEEAREVGVVYTPAPWGFSSKIGFKTDAGLVDYGNSSSGPDFSSFYIMK